MEKKMNQFVLNKLIKEKQGTKISTDDLEIKRRIKHNLVHIMKIHLPMN